MPFPKSLYYPISLEEVEKNVSRRMKRRATHQARYSDSDGWENVKTILNPFGEKIIRVDGEIPIDLKVARNKRFLFISYDQSRYTHALHKYPAKFFPELPRWLIKKYSQKEDWILDPFTGSGTTNIEALLAERNSMGVDVDDFSRFLTKVKVTPLPRKELIATQEQLLNAIVKYHPRKVSKKDVPNFPYRDNWFNSEITSELAYIKKTIESLKTRKEVKDFYLVCFSSIIRAVSNADDNCTRTVIRKKLNKKIYPGDALKKFAETVLVNVPRMLEFKEKCLSNTIIQTKIPSDSDARKINAASNTFDMAVTSPPYANAVDYPRTHQLELYWLGFETGSLTPLKKKHVGTESVSSEDYNILHKIGIRSADKIIKRIYQKDSRRAFIAYKYLSDMEQNLKEVLRTLKPGGRYVLVVGNNRIRKEVFESWKYIKALAERNGYITETYFGSEIIKHFIKVPRDERIDTDRVLVLKKPK